ncbi:hypothetical protein NKG05_23730 [Oerskovia sp. M15]
MRPEWAEVRRRRRPAGPLWPARRRGTGGPPPRPARRAPEQVADRLVAALERLRPWEREHVLDPLRRRSVAPSSARDDVGGSGEAADRPVGQGQGPRPDAPTCVSRSPSCSAGRGRSRSTRRPAGLRSSRSWPQRAIPWWRCGS